MSLVDHDEAKARRVADDPRIELLTSLGLPAVTLNRPEVPSPFPAVWLDDRPGTIAVVQHRSTEPPNMLARVLGRHTSLTVKTAEEGEVMRPGTVYLAPSDHHLQVQSGGVFHLMNGRRILHLRSSANPLFDSAAGVFDGHLIAVALTGHPPDEIAEELRDLWQRVCSGLRRAPMATAG